MAASAGLQAGNVHAYSRQCYPRATSHEESKKELQVVNGHTSGCCGVHMPRGGRRRGHHASVDVADPPYTH